MSMLAGPRRKQKVINLRAKNNAWSNDANKFGQKMLEKMGWSSGKGLGAKENGIVDHVVARYKNDERGLGFEDRNDQWTKHEDDFNALLANLSNGDSNADKLHSGVSLEDKSKKSRTRVHYHKFTRGKDLTKYSEKDLANIFGKKSLKNEEKVEKMSKEDVKTTEQVFTEKGSMEDYFKSKLAAFKSQNKINFNKIGEENEVEADYNFRGFSGTKSDDESKDHQGFGFQSFSFYTDDNNTENTTIIEHTIPTETTKKSKKKKKSKYQNEESITQHVHTDIQSENYTISDENNVDEIVVHLNKKSKKKLKNDDTQQELTEKKKSKNKKPKNRDIPQDCDNNTTENLAEIECVTENYHVPKKKKKRKCIES